MTQSIHAEYVDEKQEKELSSEYSNITAQVTTLVVDSQESMDKANNMLTWIVDRQKKIDDFRVGIVKPIKDHLKKIDGYFNGWYDKYDQSKNEIVKKVSAYRSYLEVEARKRMPKPAPGVPQIQNPVAPAERTTSHDLGQVTYKKHAEFKINNPDNVPDEFWIIDEKKVGARVRELTGSLAVGKRYTDKIAGITIEVTERPSVRGN